MPSLHELQRAFARAVFEGDAAAVAGLIRARGIPAPDRLSVYRNNVLGNLRDALADVFETVHALVGAEFFDHAAECYARRTPSGSGDLNDYGAGFPEFLRDFAPAASLVYLPDAARLDWACHESLLAPDPEPGDFTALAAVDPADYPRIRFEVHPALRLLRSPYPLFRIRRICTDPAAADERVDLAAGADCLVVARPGAHVGIATVTPGQFELLAALQRGEPFGAACDRALAVDPDADVSAWLHAQVAAGNLTGWRLT